MASDQDEIKKRAATVLTIAQHKFKQALKKADDEAGLEPLSLEQSAQCLSDIDAVLKQNTPANVQNCTEWIVNRITSSKARIAVLGDYLVSLAKSIVIGEQESPAAAREAVRGRMNVLLIVNDVLHTDKSSTHTTGKRGFFGSEFSSHLAELVELVAGFISGPGLEVERRLKALINFWAINEFVDAEDVSTLEERVDQALLVAQGGMPVRKRTYLLPEYHGDRNAPWYELPAAYMLEPMIKNPNQPIDPSQIKIAKFDRKPVSAHVRGLLDNFFENLDLNHTPTADNPTGETKKFALDLDECGQIIKREKATGKTTLPFNGYGWSPKFCQDMREDGVPEAIRKAREQVKREEELQSSREPSHQRSRSSSQSSYTRERGRRHRSRSSSSPYMKQDSRSKSRGRSRSRGRSPAKPINKGSDDFDLPRQPHAPYERQAANAAPGSSNNAYPAPVHPPFDMPSFPPNPNPFPGQFPMQPFPSPPFQQGPFPGGAANFGGPFPHASPDMAAMPNNAYNVGNFGHGYGNNFTHGNNQNANFQGGRGGYRGNYQGRGNNRGGYGGSQRGYRGGRW